MVKLVLQITAGVLNCKVPPQRDNEHLSNCVYQAGQDKLEASMAKSVLHSTAEANMMKLALHMATEVNV